MGSLVEVESGRRPVEVPFGKLRVSGPLVLSPSKDGATCYLRMPRVPISLR